MTDDPELAALRGSIDNIDSVLIHVLAERFKITRKVGEYKKAKGMPAADLAREAEQIARLKQLAVDANLDPEFSEKFLQFIIREVIRLHEQVGEG